jgi:hypothetical protein
MADGNERITVGVEELVLTNSMTLAALVELLDERGVMKQAEVQIPGQGGRDSEIIPVSIPK